MPQIGDTRPGITAAERREQERKRFAEKNKRRKQARTHDSRRKIAKELRQAFGGAFGRSKPKLYDLCIVGTLGEERTKRVPVEQDLPVLKDGIELGKQQVEAANL